MVKPLVFMPGLGSSMYIERDSTVQIDGLLELVVGSDSQLGCLALYVLMNSTTTNVTNVFLRTAEG
jgi:hypothetical protein